MNIKRICLWVIFISFSVFSSWVMWKVGYAGIWQAGMESPGSFQILLDLAICCLVICSWINADARSRGINPYPWFVAVLTTGSLAILVYLIAREHQKSANPTLQTH